MEWLFSRPVVLQALLASLFTYGMTALGALTVLCSRRFPQKGLTLMTGFAAGIMISASFFSLLLPSLDYETALPSWLAVSIGFCLGGLFLALFDFALEKARGTSSGVSLLVFSVTLHNIPEGMAVGVAFGAAGGVIGGTVSALSLALGIGIQNFPEGLCLAFPLHASGCSRFKSFFIAQLSGVVEVFAALLGAFFVSMTTAILPWVLSFSAGAMIAVVCSELIPGCFAADKRLSCVSVILGFTLMMLFDLALG